MKKTLISLAMVFLFFGLIGAANADVFSFDDPDLSGWYQDRFSPEVFETKEFDGDNRLHIGISGADQQGQSFYNYQGNKHDFGDPLPEYSIVGDLFVDSEWETGSWNVGMWGTLFDENDDVSGYPIITYRNSDQVEAGFYGFDYRNGGWFPVLSVTEFDQWYSLEMAYDDLGLNYFVNGQEAASFQDSYPSDRIGNIILNSYNFGENYDVYWDNVGTRNAPVPEPGTFFLLGVGMLGLAGYRKKFKK